MLALHLFMDARATIMFPRMAMAMAMATMALVAKVGIDPLGQKALLGLSEMYNNRTTLETKVMAQLPLVSLMEEKARVANQEAKQTRAKARARATSPSPKIRTMSKNRTILTHLDPMDSLQGDL